MPSQVFHKQKACYLAIDKIATGTLNTIFKQLIPDAEYISKIDDTPNTSNCARSPITHQVKASDIKEQFPDYQIFTFTRNPYDRCIFGYFPCIRGPKDLQYQSWYIDREVDFMGRYETLLEDYQKICSEILHVQPIKINLRIHQTKNKQHYSLYYTEQAKKIITIEFREDIDRFGYKF